MSIQRRQLERRMTRCVTRIVKPLRIFQFLVILLLFAFTIYMIVMVPAPMSTLACILLIALSGTYVFVLAVDLIGQFSTGVTHILPMFTFSVLGVLVFGTAGILLICNAYTKLPVQITALTLCLLAALLFLIDVIMILIHLSRRCSICRRKQGNPTNNPIHKNSESRTDNIMKRDITTSVSSMKVPSELEGIVTPEHCFRKIQHPRRREYVDCQTCVPSLCTLNVAQVQTELKPFSMGESQTFQPDMKETTIQTSSKCELCHRQMLPLTSTINGVASSSSPQHWTAYPALVQFIRDGITVPCCPGCKCVTDVTQQQQQQQQQQRQKQSNPISRQLIRKSEPDRMLTSEKAPQQVANSIPTINNKTTPRSMENTKSVLASISPTTSHRGGIRTVPTNYMNIVYKTKIDKTKVKDDAKQSNKGSTMPSVDQEIVDKIIAPKKLTIIQSEEKKEKTENPTSRKNSTHELKSVLDQENIGKGKEVPIDEFKHSSNVAKYQEKEYVSNHSRESPKHNNITTQVSSTLITSSNNRKRSRTLLNLKMNKVDPMNDGGDASNENRVKSASTEYETPKVARINQTVQEDSESSSVDGRTHDVCSHCKRRKTNLTASLSSDNPRYYSVFKDKWGRYFCEFCAPLDSRKVVNRVEIRDLRKSRCTNCKFSLLGRINGTNIQLKMGTCPKCGQSQ